MDGLKMVLNMIDLTTLEGKDTPGKVRQMCYKAIHLHDSFPGLPTVAAVCGLSFNGRIGQIYGKRFGRKSSICIYSLSFRSGSFRCKDYRHKIRCGSGGR